MSASTGCDAALWLCGSEKGRTMSAAVYRFYVGIDWATEKHRVVVLDAERRVVREREAFGPGPPPPLEVAGALPPRRRPAGGTRPPHQSAARATAPLLPTAPPPRAGGRRALALDPARACSDPERRAAPAPRHGPHDPQPSSHPACRHRRGPRHAARARAAGRAKDGPGRAASLGGAPAAPAVDPSAAGGE